MKILVTGSNGQLGSELRLYSGDFPQHNFFFTDIEELDICDKKAVYDFVALNNIELIINCAAYNAVDKAETDSTAAFELNAVAVEALCHAAKANNSFVVHISTDFVFDGQKKTPYTETDTPGPLSIYAASKFKGEEIVLNSKIPSYIIRTSWLYSSFGNNFVKTIMRLAKEKPELRVVNDQIGSPSYARDLAEAILNMISYYTLPEKPELYHYSNEGEISWFDFAKNIVEFSALNTRVLPISALEFNAAAKRPAYSVMDKKKIKDSFGLTIPYWEDSLKKCIELLK
ncbi:MAG: dTDP-4-dehydrorhamnose reductase [Bacteroidales bacterium]|jgi:dTDP-4-dehydrorhamnose reductase|nr:dTDP-4-dehydrorhamnose reductase [Bacteroidales bacterium]MDD4214251.1 dTDP-4-dehydrorhamnose reductase [Bacteroidales bacterium]